MCEVCDIVININPKTVAQHESGKRHQGRLNARKRFRELPPPPMPLHLAALNVAYEDEHMLVLNKPHDLLSVPGNVCADNLCSRARARGGRWAFAEAVHRLDMETSGLIILALSADARTSFGAQFRDRTLDKVYMALVDGDVAGESGECDDPMRPDTEHRVRQIVDREGGKSASTTWRRLGRPGVGPAAASTLMELRPTTGRTHQLRVHMAALGHPILGDTLYSGGDERVAAGRLMLHATRLEFDHPTTKERIVVEAKPVGDVWMAAAPQPQPPADGLV